MRKTIAQVSEDEETAPIALVGVLPEDMAAINRLALKELEPEDVAVFRGQVANNQIDRDGERFHEDVLADFSETLPGKSLLASHNWSSLGIGRWFAAWLEPRDEDDRVTLMAKAYFLRGPADETIRLIEGGVVWALSIGFFAPSRIELKDPDGYGEYAEYRRGPNGEKAEAIEASVVMLGAQFDAQLVKVARRTKALASEPRCACGRLEDLCQLDQAVVTGELALVDRLIRLKREAPAGIEESFSALHARRARVAKALEAVR